MQCSKCGASVTPDATFCNQCGRALGAPQQVETTNQTAPKKGTNKVLGCLGIGAIALILLLIIGSLAPKTDDKSQVVSVDNASIASGNASTSNNAPTNAVSEEAPLPLAVTVSELAGAYENNEASAQAYFGDRRLLVSGTVDKVTLDFGDDPVVLLRTSNEFMPAHASMADDAKSEASDFSRGDKIRLLCEDVSEVIGTPMLKECRTAPAGAKGARINWKK